jgi:hypothetical protein
MSQLDANPALAHRICNSIMDYCRSGVALERHLVVSFIQMQACGHYETDIPMSPEDTIVEEMSFRYGRADLVVFHIDGTASVIEAKDGSKGYSHVVAGIGQASLYASQLAMTRGALKKVRRCLMWSSTRDEGLDALIWATCKTAGVVPLIRASGQEMVEVARQGLRDVGVEY